jgi:Rieske 2Fe-2S family protein
MVMSEALVDSNESDHNALDKTESTLPMTWYYDRDHYELELERIWCRKWLYLCREESLARPRAYQTLKIGSQRIWVARTDEGELVGYYNACRHRGSLLLTQPEGRLRSNRIRCPYHNWCYSIDNGNLLATSSFAEPRRFSKSDYGLFPIAVHSDRGFIFVNLDAEAEWKADEIFDTGWSMQESYPVQDWKIGHSWTRSFSCNWKTFWDNFGECLHCPTVHPALVKLVPIFKRGLMEQRDHPDWRKHVNDPNPKYRGGLREGAETFSMDGSAQGYIDRSRYTDEELRRGAAFAVALPGVYIACHPDHARVSRVLPTGPESMELQVEWMFQPEALADPGYDISNITKFIKQVLIEDGEVSELNQSGMHAAPMKQGVLMPEEYEVRNYRDWLLAALRD